MTAHVAAQMPTRTTSLAAGLRQLARPERGRLLVVGLVVVIAAAVELVPALVVRHVIDHDLTPRRTTGLGVAGLVYLGAVAAVAILTAWYGYVAAGVAQRSLAGLRTRLFDHLLALPASYHDSVPIGDSISRATADVEIIDDLFSSSAATLLGETVRLVTVLIAMVVLSPALTGVSMLAVPPLVLMSNYLRHRIRDAERATRIAVGALNIQLNEDLTAADVIRAFGRQESFADRFRRALTQWLVASNRSTFYNAFYAPGIGMLSAAAAALLLWTGANGGFGAAVTLGTLTAFVLLISRFFSPLINLGDEWQTVQAALAGAERVFTVLDIPAPRPPDTIAAGHTHTPNRHPPGVIGSSVRADHVSFGYTGGEPVLHDVSLRVEPGEYVAVVGRTGAGKSTLLALLAGLYPVTTGTVDLYGHNPCVLPDSQRRPLLGFVPQQVNLFDGTVHDNLTLGDATITPDLVRRAAVISGADRFIQTLPSGYATHLSAASRGAGVQLSAGQRQLLALARALTVGPTVLLLDEATAVIDGDSDAAFRAALHDHVLPSGTAILTVAHRLATARDAHRVLVMAGGRIIEQGTPADLLAADGTFAALSALEAAGWDWQHDTETL